MRFEDFDRAKHVFENESFLEIVKDAVRFLHGTPVQPLPPRMKFEGSGIYLLYYTGSFPAYQGLSARNRLAYEVPIYVGKAVPAGWRQGRVRDSDQQNLTLHSRLKQHTRNLDDAENLDTKDFACRFMIFDGSTTSMISTVEAFLISALNPLWNSTIDGFGNHDPGKGRYEQENSHWDSLHPGRSFAKKLRPASATIEEIVNQISTYLNNEPKN